MEEKTRDYLKTLFVGFTILFVLSGLSFFINLLTDKDSSIWVSFAIMFVSLITSIVLFILSRKKVNKD